MSFAINDRPGVGAATRARILLAAEELGWRPSASARALTEARARAVGLVLARDLSRLELDAFFMRFLSGVEQTLAPRDYALLLQLVPAGAELGAGAYDRLAAAGRVDGFLLTDVELEDRRFERLEAAGLPVVIAGHPAGDAPFPWVETDHARGVTDVVAHLAGLGHRDIAFVGGPAAYEFIQVRLARWREGVAAAGLTPGAVAHVEDGDTEAIGAVLDTRPTAVVCTSDPVAMAVIGVARERGVDVPGDLSVTGFDDSPLAALASPALTSVRVDYVEFGAAATAALLAAIGGEEPPAHSPSPPSLVVRASTAPPG